MKRTYFYIAIITVLITTSCDKKLDVLPENNITPGQIQTAEDLKAVLFGAYKLYQGPAAFGEQFMLIPDLLASESQVDWVGTFTEYRQYQNKEQLKDNGLATGIWENTYKIILDANTVLDKISLIEDEDEKSVITGEAEFMRGVAYFELVNLYSQPYSAGNITDPNSGVPIVLEPVYIYDSTKHKPSRATIDEVYKQALTDLTDAVAKLPEDNGTGRVDKYTAEAFLARVYMNMSDYENAAAMANDVISSGKYALASPYDKAFNNDGYSPEDIFAIAQTNQSNAGTSNNGLTTFYSPQAPEGVGRGDAQVNPDYLSIFDPDDTRGYFFTNGISISGFDGLYTNKWLQAYKYIPVVRLAEMYLTRGEANLRKGGAPIGGVDPPDDINIVRERSNAFPLSGVTGNDFVEERFRELGFEGDRLWTLKRLQQDVDGRSFDDEKLVLPIPQRETDVNKNLTQNPGY
jgi:tetratricopeptide (TPR) repeat protein